MSILAFSIRWMSQWSGSWNWYIPNLAPLNKKFNLLTWKVQRQCKMPIVSLERLLNLSTRAFYLKKCEHEEKEGRLFALLWATREYYDLKVSNKVKSIQHDAKEASQHVKSVTNTIYDFLRELFWNWFTNKLSLRYTYQKNIKFKIHTFIFTP